jgi:hypothetical protein
MFYSVLQTMAADAVLFELGVRQLQLQGYHLKAWRSVTL